MIFGVISAKRTFKGYSEEHTMIKLEEYISLSEGKTVSGRFSIDWTKTFEGQNKIVQIVIIGKNVMIAL